MECANTKSTSSPGLFPYGWGRPTHFFYGESLGDEVGTKGKMSFSEMRYHGRNHRIKEAFHKNNESNFFLYPSSLPFFLNLFH